MKSQHYLTSDLGVLGPLAVHHCAFIKKNLSLVTFFHEFCHF